MNQFLPLSRGLDAIAARVTEVLGAKFLSQAIAHEELTIEVAADDIVAVLAALRDDPELRFVSFVDLCGVDYPEREKRFDVVYHLLSPHKNHRIRIKLATDAETPVPSISDVFPAATWFEREAYDFYGITFTGHPDLTRILLPEDWVGWPLRKDSPLGYEEVAFTHNTPGRTVPSPSLKKLAPKKVRYRAQ